MTFTKEQKEQLIRNGKQIYEYILKNICPCVKESINIPFGEMCFRGRRNEIYEKEYTLIVRSDEVFGNQGGLVLYFDVPDWAKNSCGTIDMYKDCYGIEYLYNLCLNWGRIKEELNDNIKKWKDEQKQVFENFVL